jgi:cobalt-zinc-cadmium efflux system membrane fusion protein
MNLDQIIKATSLSITLLLGTSGCGSGPADETSAHGRASSDEHPSPAVVQIDAADLDRMGIRIAEAGPADLEVTTELPGEVQVNGDRMAHVAPRVGGVVREVHASLGDTVRRGQLLADLVSRELADAKAAFLAAAERMTLADATHRREERLWKEKVSSEQDFLDARRNRAEARIELRTAEQKLHALGVPQSQLDQLPNQHDAMFTEYKLTAPFAGTIIDRHITIGETVSAGTPVFTVADLQTVWIDLSVYQKEIGTVRKGQSVRVGTPHGDDVELSIDFVQPLVGEDTRTATARIIAPNPDGIWHPGCFVTARVTTSKTEARVVVPVSAVIRMEDGDDVVFVEADEGFEPRHVVLGRRTRDHAEVVSGLDQGERYVEAGGFILKAELGKDAFGDPHGH